jgi:hypothetical protein
MGGRQNCKQIAYVFILGIDTFLWRGGWEYNESQEQLSTRLVKIIDFITKLIRSGGGAVPCASIISDCSDYSRICGRYATFHIPSFGRATETTGKEIWQCGVTDWISCWKRN